MANEKKHFPGISPHAFEHPLDATALLALQKAPGLDWIVKHFLSAIGERRLRLLFLASAVRVGHRQFPKLRELLEEACAVLDIDQPPELFVTQHFALNAAAIGVERSFIVVTSTMLDTMDDEEVQCVLGHELGHILCGHVLYTTVLVLLLRMWYLFLGIPGGIYAVIAIRLALLEWRRKAELSADRAGLLVSQSPELSYQVDMKLAGGRLHEQMDLDAFLKQAKEYETGGDLLDGVLKLTFLASESHPFPVLRVSELRKWVESGDYDAILAGGYRRRELGIHDSWLDRVKDTASGYTASLNESADPLLATLRDLGAGAAATGTDAFALMRRALGLGDEGKRNGQV